ncbi:MAG: LTA synthase family protein [Bacteroidia bacterium]|nr:LTA synthase family protein [Bacteroidia bacterium]
MSNRTFLPRLIIFWLTLFFIARIGFLVLLAISFPHYELSQWPLCFVYGFRLDLSAISYLVAIPALLWLAYLLLHKKWLIQLIHGINQLFLLLTISLLLGNLGIYEAWGTLLNARALSFLQDPEGITASLTTMQLILQLSGLFLLFWIALRSYRIFIRVDEAGFTAKKDLLFPALFLLLLPVGMRGGFQEIPINESSAYFSEVSPLNHAATNPAWYLLNNVSKSGLGKKNPYVFMPEEEMAVRFGESGGKESTSLRVLQAARPNVVLIVLESWTADIIGPLNGRKDVTPFFNALCDSGILFSQIYSSGRRTDQMFPSLLSGFPAQPNHSLSRFTDKLRKLPMLSHDFNEMGYQTSFHYGGELGFANMNTFLLEAKFKQIVGKNDFEDRQMNSKWGAHDEFLFDKLLTDLNKTKEPFFSMALTLSTHEPFEVPGEIHHAKMSEPDKFRRAAGYTDRCMASFFRRAKKTSWYNNTLFIFVADHGHPLPERRDYYDPECYHIPLLFYGMPLDQRYRGTMIQEAGSQHDLAATLLSQYKLSSEAYTFSRNLLAPDKSRGVFLNYDNGFGWKMGQEQFVFLFGEKRFLPSFTSLKPGSDSSAVRNGQAYLQKLYADFLKL